MGSFLTLKDLETLSDNEILIRLINTRLNKIHPYVPERDRLNMIRQKLVTNESYDTREDYLKWIGKKQEVKN